MIGFLLPLHLEQIGRFSSTLTRLLGIAGLAIAFVWISIWARFRDLEPETPMEPSPLNAWDFLGCHALEIGSWVGTDPTEIPSTIRYLMLFPDSLDEYGREYPSYRATTIRSGENAAGISIRWFTRADTLWFVWSDDLARGGAALRKRGGELTGRAVAEFHSDSVSSSLEATANAWKVNCYTLEPSRFSQVNR